MFKATGTEADGVHEGQKGKTLPQFNYTGRTVVGLKAWQKARLTEMARVKPLEGCWKKPGDGYPERYGLNWEAVLDAFLRKTICPVTDLMDHVIVERRRLRGYGVCRRLHDFPRRPLVVVGGRGASAHAVPWVRAPPDP